MVLCRIMGFRATIDPQEPDSPRQKLVNMLHAHLRSAASAQVSRVGKVGALQQRWEIDPLEDGDDYDALVSDLADAMLAVAEADAGDATRSYVFALLGNSTPRQAARVVGSISLRIGEGASGGSGGDPIRAVTKLADQLGAQNARLADAQIGMIERIGPLMADWGSRAGEAQVRLAELELTQQRWMFDRQEIRSLLNGVGGFLKDNPELVTAGIQLLSRKVSGKS